MLVVHDDISTGKWCVAGDILADGADVSTSHGSMVLCTHIVVLAKDQHLVANERGQSFIDGCNNDRWPNDTCHVKVFSHNDYCDIR